MEATFRHVTVVPRWFLVSALLIVFIPIATFILNHSTVHNLILPHLTSQFRIEMGGLRIHLVPHPSIEVFDLLVRDDRTSEPVLRAPRASLSVRLWPLLTKQVRLLELSAVEPRVLIRRDGDGVWHFPLIDETKRTEPNNIADTKWVIAHFHVMGGTLLIVDEDRLAPGGVRIHHVQGALDSNDTQTHAKVDSPR
jgi:uncharacterized protein involved in outer membrane biogenesis